MRPPIFALLTALAGLLPAARATSADAVIGAKPPEWAATEWLNSEPLSLAGLHGKVVVVRWWTGAGCPYCAASAPTLNALSDKYRDRGLVVVGMYHHKDEAPLTRGYVEGQMKRIGIRFPVAIDRDWRTLHRWWLDRQSGAAWTSVTFVIDREGVVRHVHPGGALVEGKPDYAEFEKSVIAALGN